MKFRTKREIGVRYFNKRNIDCGVILREKLGTPVSEKKRRDYRVEICFPNDEWKDFI
jgi:hypothetical protein